MFHITNTLPPSSGKLQLVLDDNSCTIITVKIIKVISLHTVQGYNNFRWFNMVKCFSLSAMVPTAVENSIQ